MIRADHLSRGGPLCFFLRARTVLAIGVLVTAVGACTVDDGSGSETRTTTSSTTSAPATPTSTTAAPPQSVGIVEVAAETHEITADCYAAGAGEVVAIGIAEPADGRRVEVYLQAFLGAPYLGIRITDPAGTTVLYEAAVDRPLDIIYDADILRADDVALVTDLDLETGESTEAGIGTVVIECRAYGTELPEGFAGG